LRHTEGGGEAMLKFSQADVGQDQEIGGLGLGITKLDEETAPKALSSDEHAAMLKVLRKDAGEVDEVVSEISDRLADMEEHLSQIQAYISMLRVTTSRQQDALRILKRVSAHVPSHINACAEFQAAWEEEKEVLASKVDEIEGLHEFYIAFASGYDNLILEVQRRRHVKREMEKIAKRAMSDINKIYKGKNSQALSPLPLDRILML
jgi:autophagy-related protein 17